MVWLVRDKVLNRLLPEGDVKECRLCHAFNSTDGQYCTTCGACMLSICPKCNHDVGPKHVYCENCGHFLGGSGAHKTVGRAAAAMHGASLLAAVGLFGTVTASFDSHSSLSFWCAVFADTVIVSMIIHFAGFFISIYGIWHTVHDTDFTARQMKRYTHISWVLLAAGWITLGVFLLSRLQLLNQIPAISCML